MSKQISKAEANRIVYGRKLYKCESVGGEWVPGFEVVGHGAGVYGWNWSIYISVDGGAAVLAWYRDCPRAFNDAPRITYDEMREIGRIASER